MLARPRPLLFFLAACAALIVAACLLSSPFSPSPTALLDPDDPDYRLSPPSSGEYYNVWDPANNVHESYYGGKFQRGGAFDRDLSVGGGRLTGSIKVGNLDLGSGSAAQNAYAAIIGAIKTAFVRARAARLQKSLAASSSIAAVSSRVDSHALRIRRIRSGLASLASSTRNALASQSYRIGRLAAETRSALINQNTRISDASDDVKQLNGQQRVDVSRLHVLLRNQHALARLGAAAFVKANSVLGLAMRAQADAAQSESEANDARVVVGRAAQRIASLQRTHNENVAYILQIAHALLKTNSLVHDLAYEDLEKIRSDIESGAVRQDSLETLIALLTKHTDQRFVKVAKEMKKQNDVVEGVHKRMDRVEDEMQDTQGKFKALKERVKDDVEKLEKKMRAIAAKARPPPPPEDDDEEEEESSHHHAATHHDEEEEEESSHHHAATHHVVHHISEHHIYHHAAQHEGREHESHESSRDQESHESHDSRSSDEREHEHGGGEEKSDRGSAEEHSSEHSSESSEERSGESSEEHSGR